MNIEMLSPVRFFFCSVDLYMLYRFLNSMFSGYRVEKKRVIWCFLTTTLAIFLVNAQVSSVLNLMAVPICYLVFASLVFRTSLGNRIIYTLIFYAVFAGGKEVAFEILRRFLSSFIPFFMAPWHSAEGIAFLLIEYLFSFLFLVFMEQFTIKLEISEEVGISYYLLILPMASILILSSFLYMEFPESREIQGLMCSGAFLLYFSNAAVFVLLAKFTSIMKRHKVEALYQVKQTMESDNFQVITDLNKKYREYIHDMQAYFRSIRALAGRNDNQKIIEIVNGLDDRLYGGEFHVYCLDNVMNSILTNCRIRAANEGIDLTVCVEEGINLSFIQSVDKVSMFGNLLDNACEAAAEGGENKGKIAVKIYMSNHNFCVFWLENTFVHKMCRNQGEYISTKKEEGTIASHGLGIGIVRRLTEKYQGTFSIEEKEDTFAVTLVLPIPVK